MFRVADTYGVEVPPGQNPVVILAATAALDAIAHLLGDPPQRGGLNGEVLVAAASTPAA
jgi:hypothetical protein